MANGNIHDCREELRSADLRVTPARLGVLSVLEHTDEPADVSTVMRYLKKSNVAADEVTVFRIIRAFTEKGLIQPIRFNEGKTRYEYAGKPKHHHFVCESCGSVTDVTDCNVHTTEKRIERAYGVKVKRHALEFFGTCGRCRA